VNISSAKPCEVLLTSQYKDVNAFFKKLTDYVFKFTWQDMQQTFSVAMAFLPGDFGVPRGL
jgi:hypothetical protein